MGLLSGIGRELKGLLRSGELVDTLAEAQAYLEGDYGSAMQLGERDLARRRARRDARRRAEEEARRAAEAEGPRLYEGMTWDDPETGRRYVRRNGDWAPWGMGSGW